MGKNANGRRERLASQTGTPHDASQPFCRYDESPAAQFGDQADLFMAAAGHYGNKSSQLIKHYAEDLGYEYLQASNKEEYLEQVKRFLTPSITDRPILFEVFTNHEDESEALEIINKLIVDQSTGFRKTVKSILPSSVTKVLKDVIKK